MIKKAEPTNELCIKFTEDEMAELNIAIGDKFTVHEENGGFLFKKYIKVELDISDWSREVLEFLVGESCESDVSVSEVITRAIERVLPPVDGEESDFPITDPGQIGIDDDTLGMIKVEHP